MSTDGSASPGKDEFKQLAKRNKELLKRLTPAQRDLLLRRLGEITDDVAAAQTPLVARPHDPDSPVPLSFAQERIWFLDRLSPQDPGHGLTGALWLRGRLDEAALAQSLDAIVARHEPLRSRILPNGGVPTQEIDSSSSLAITRHDLTGVPRADRDEACRQRYLEELQRGFDLEREHPVRATLVRVDTTEWFLIVGLHSIAGDGWSIGVLLQELAQAYRCASEGKPIELAPLAVSYGDVAAWQRERLTDTVLEDGLSYWREQLADPPMPSIVPPDPRPSSQDRGALVAMELSNDLRSALEEYSRQGDTTLFVTMLSAYLMLLMRLSGETDLLIGVPMSGRNRVETEALVGSFLNTLPLRARIEPEMSATEVQAIVRQHVLDGLERIDVPFEKVVQEVASSRGGSGPALFDTVFNLTPPRVRRLELADLIVSHEPPPVMTAKFATELFVADAGDRI